MQGRFTEEWMGKTVRIYIAEIKKLDWNGVAWETKFVLMAKKEWESYKTGKDSAPVVSFFKEVAVSDEFTDLASLRNMMQHFVGQTKKRLYENFGPAAPFNESEFLEIFKHSDTDILDVEEAKEQAQHGHTYVKVCTTKKDEQDCNNFESEYIGQQELFNPHYDPPPPYRERT